MIRLLTASIVVAACVFTSLAIASPQQSLEDAQKKYVDAKKLLEDSKKAAAETHKSLLGAIRKDAEKKAADAKAGADDAQRKLADFAKAAEDSKRSFEQAQKVLQEVLKAEAAEAETTKTDVDRGRLGEVREIAKEVVIEVLRAIQREPLPDVPRRANEFPVIGEEDPAPLNRRAAEKGLGASDMIVAGRASNVRNLVPNRPRRVDGGLAAANVAPAGRLPTLMHIEWRANGAARRAALGLVGGAGGSLLQAVRDRLAQNTNLAENQQFQISRASQAAPGVGAAADGRGGDVGGHEEVVLAFPNAEDAKEAEDGLMRDGNVNVTYSRVFFAKPEPIIGEEGLVGGRTLADSTAANANIATNISVVNAPVFWNRNITGQNIRVAVIDSGANPHNALGARLEQGATFLGPGNSDQHVQPVTGAFDDNGHGTHVAGTIAGETVLNAGVRTSVGMAPAAMILPLRALKDTIDARGQHVAEGREIDILDAFEFAIRRNEDNDTQNNVHVINFSLGFDPTQPSRHAQRWRALAVRAENAGIVIVAAAGNHQDKTDQFGRALAGLVGLPATLHNAVSVGAVARNGAAVEPYSVFNSSQEIPDLAAPGGGLGGGILSTSRLGGDNGALLAGTSMATPHVAGAFALLRSDPRFASFSAAQLRQEIFQNHVNSSTSRPETGRGILRMDDGGPNNPPQPPVVSSPAGDPVILGRLKQRIDYWARERFPPYESVND
jgi:subtilisin family serine protease